MKTLKKLRIVLFTLLVILFMSNCEKAPVDNCKECEVRYYTLRGSILTDVTDIRDVDGDDKVDPIEYYTLCNDELLIKENIIEIIYVGGNDFSGAVILYRKLLCK